MALPSLDTLAHRRPDEVLAIITRYDLAGRVAVSEADFFSSARGPVWVPFLELLRDEGGEEPAGEPVLLLLPSEDESMEDIANLARIQIMAGHVRVECVPNGRSLVVDNQGRDLALLTRGRGVCWRPEDFLDYQAGLNLRALEGPPVSLHILGDEAHPLPGSSPELKLELLCEAIETRGGPTGETRVLVEITAWSDLESHLLLSPSLLERLAANQVSLRLWAVPSLGAYRVRLAIQRGQAGRF